MDFIRDFLNTYGSTILYTALTAIAGYVGIAIKNIISKHINNKTKREIARTCVRAIEQIYKELHGDEKLNKCIEAVTSMLAEKGITVTEFEIRMLIESAVNELNCNFRSDDTDEKAGD